ncbi:MAG: helix-turn-helix transcriptional regulator [Phycisphaerae bacterium]|nr:helix-turn-helix transcriptional regulator [Phycisphaerae bacterium]
MPTFMNGHGWRATGGIEGICVVSTYEHNTPPLRKSPNYHLPTWALLYIYHGSLWHSYSPRERTYLQTSSQALLYPPGADRYEFSANRELLHGAYLLFKDSKESHLKRLFKSPSEWVVFDDDDEGTLGSLMKECAAIGYRRGDAGFWDSQAVLCRIVGVLLSSIPIERNRYKVSVFGNPVEDDDLPLSQKIDAYLQSQIDRIITLDDISKELGVSVSTLTHRYQKEAGVPVMSAFIQKRIDRIKELLRRGYSVKLIAHQMSFSESSALSIFFKRHTGVSPREFLYRQKRSLGSEGD